MESASSENSCKQLLGNSFPNFTPWAGTAGQHRVLLFFFFQEETTTAHQEGTTTWGGGGILTVLDLTMNAFDYFVFMQEKEIIEGCLVINSTILKTLSRE